MSYTNSKAIAGRGTQFFIGPVAGTSSPTYTLVGELDDASPTGRAWNTADATNFQSASDEEFITTTRNPGEFDVTGNYVSGDTGQAALLAAHNAGALYMFKLQFPLAQGQTTTGDTWTFNALVLNVDPSKITVKDVIKLSAKLKVSGARTVVAGS